MTKPTNWDEMTPDEKKAVTLTMIRDERGSYILSQALYRAIEVMKEDPHPEYTNIEDMEMLMEVWYPMYAVTQDALKTFAEMTMEDDGFPPGMFKKLTQGVEPVFRQWARDNYKPGVKINPAWHPVVRAECKKMNEERKLNTEREVRKERRLPKNAKKRGNPDGR